MGRRYARRAFGRQDRRQRSETRRPPHAIRRRQHPHHDRAPPVRHGARRRRDAGLRPPARRHLGARYAARPRRSGIQEYTDHERRSRAAPADRHAQPDHVARRRMRALPRDGPVRKRRQARERDRARHVQDGPRHQPGKLSLHRRRDLLDLPSRSGQAAETAGAMKLAARGLAILALWTLYAFFAASQNFMSRSYSGGDMQFMPSLKFSGLDAYLWAALTPVAFLLAGRLVISRANWWWAGPVLLIAGIAIGVLHLIVFVRLLPLAGYRTTFRARQTVLVTKLHSDVLTCWR